MSLPTFWSRLGSVRRRAPKRVRHLAHFEPVLGTLLELQVIGDSAEAGKEAERQALAEIDRLAAIFNRYSDRSELARWEATFGEFVPVSPELAYLLELAEKWRRWTGEAFHPAVHDLTQRWGQGTEPSEEELAPILTAMREPLWEVRDGMAMRRTRLAANLNAIAKGYIVDRACEAAQLSPGVSEVLVNIGGDLRHRGNQGVEVGISDPFVLADNAPPVMRIWLREMGLATSGDRFRGFEVDGRRFSHLLDPRTGHPVERIVSASVVAQDTATADVLATAFSILEPDESLALADATPGIGCLLVQDDGTLHMNHVWQSLVAPPV